MTQGTFVRDVQASSWWSVVGGTASQYYAMVSGEELYHENEQMENPGHVRWGKAFLVANIMKDVQAGQPYTATSEAESRNLAIQAFNTAKAAEVTRSWNYLNQRWVRCADEQEAKDKIGASHRVSFKCTYVKTGFCP